jgi:hypothetical protein
VRIERRVAEEEGECMMERRMGDGEVIEDGEKSRRNRFSIAALSFRCPFAIAGKSLGNRYAIPGNSMSNRFKSI